MWAYPREHSAKQQMRKCYADLTSENAEAVIDRTEKHIAYLREKFAQEKQYALMVSEICETLGINTETSSTEDVLEFD